MLNKDALIYLKRHITNNDPYYMTLGLINSNFSKPYNKPFLQVSYENLLCPNNISMLVIFKDIFQVLNKNDEKKFNRHTRERIFRGLVYYLAYSIEKFFELNDF